MKAKFLKNPFSGMTENIVLDKKKTFKRANIPMTLKNEVTFL